MLHFAALICENLRQALNYSGDQLIGLLDCLPRFIHKAALDIVPASAKSIRLRGAEQWVMPRRRHCFGYRHRLILFHQIRGAEMLISQVGMFQYIAFHCLEFSLSSRQVRTVDHRGLQQIFKQIAIVLHRPAELFGCGLSALVADCDVMCGTIIFHNLRMFN